MAPVLLLVLALTACGGRGPDGGAPRPAPAPQAAAPPPSGQPSEDAVSAVNVGVRRLEQFRYQDAIAAFEKALALAPGWTAATVDLAIAHVNALEPEHAEAARRLAQEALAREPKNARAAYVLAYTLVERERAFAEALPLLRQVIAAQPSDAFAQYQFARSAQEVASESGDAALLAEAEKGYRRALELDAGFVEANYRLGRLLVDGDDPVRYAEGEAVLMRHQEIVRGRPAVQQNYLTRGALALAHPWAPVRKPPPPPGPVGLRRAAADVTAIPAVAEGSVPPSLEDGGRPGFALADIDGDSHLDALLPDGLGAGGGVALRRGAQGGTFGPSVRIASGNACLAVAVGDLDADGDLDAVVACLSGSFLLRAADGGFGKPEPLVLAGGGAVRAADVTVVDVDHDGDLDLHLTTASADAASGVERPVILRNDGTATFTDATAHHVLDRPLRAGDSAWSDLDGDNAVDLVAEREDGALVLLVNSREGAFSEHVMAPGDPAAASGRSRLAFIDLDADGDLDVIRGVGGTFDAWRNDSLPGLPAFRSVGSGELGPEAGALTVADLDLDGVPEILVVRASPQPGPAAVPSASASVIGLGAGGAAGGLAVVLRAISAPGLDPALLAVADVDGDGDADLIGRSAAGELVVLLAEPPAANAWARITARGREGRSNAEGLGTKLWLDAGTLRQRVELRESQGPRVNVLAPWAVGLGARRGFDGATVLWPSGIRQAETDLAGRAGHLVEELDRQPSSCPMLYGWDGESFQFLSDCFDTAPLGLWVAPGVHWAGVPEERYRLRPGAALPVDGVLTLSIAEFLNESLLADHVALLAVDAESGRTVIIDEGVRLALPPVAHVAWSLGAPRAARAARLDGRDVTATLAADDRQVAGWTVATRYVGLARTHVLELDLEDAHGVLVLSGALNFSNSTNLFAAHQAGIAAAPPALEVRRGREWVALLADTGVPAGFHKDVVVDLRELLPRGPATLRLTTNLQVSWDRAALYSDARVLAADVVRDVPLVRAEKRWLGVPREVQGPENRWREFPRDGLSGTADWVRQAGPVTPDGDVAPLIAARDGQLAFVRPGEEVVVGFDASALPGPAPGWERTFVLSTYGWVKDADPHTALSASLLPLPEPGRPLYP